MTDPYGPEHVPDPVTEEAVAAAMAATDPQVKTEPWFERFFVTIIIVILAIGLTGTVIGGWNSIELGNSNQQLRIEQNCLVRLNQQLQHDENVRSRIASDDRQAVDDVIKAVSEGKNAKDIRRAFDKYFAQRKANDKKRTEYGLDKPVTDTCPLLVADSQSLD